MYCVYMSPVGHMMSDFGVNDINNDNANDNDNDNTNDNDNPRCSEAIHNVLCSDTV